MPFINKLSDETYLRRKTPRNVDIRGPYFRDQSALIHAPFFRLLKHKTQAFFDPKNSKVCTRIEHVLHVSSIAATICKGLNQKEGNLDVELTQAIALGHDIGHAPFGHPGEAILSELLQKEVGESFVHETNAYRVATFLEWQGEGLNLTYAVLDGMVSHYGEKFEQSIFPDFTEQAIENKVSREDYPSTYEGCIVRMSDKIAYVGRDIEDALMLNIITEKDIPKDAIRFFEIPKQKISREINRKIINRAILDLIDTSAKDGKIGFSDNLHKSLLILKDFNYSQIYDSQILKNYRYYVRKTLLSLYDFLSECFTNFGFETKQYENYFIKTAGIFGNFIKPYLKIYEKENTHFAKIFVDFIVSYTDNEILEMARDISLPKPVFK